MSCLYEILVNTFYLDVYGQAKAIGTLRYPQVYKSVHFCVLCDISFASFASYELKSTEEATLSRDS